MEHDDFWGEPIYSYTDEDAVNDGVLVDISSLNVKFRTLPVNRMTRTLWDELQPFLIDYTDVEKPLDVKMPSKMEQLANILRTKLKLAKNSGDDDYLFILPPNIWLVKNEVLGYTAMKPENY